MNIINHYHVLSKERWHVLIQRIEPTTVIQTVVEQRGVPTDRDRRAGYDAKFAQKVRSRYQTQDSHPVKPNGKSSIQYPVRIRNEHEYRQQKHRHRRMHRPHPIQPQRKIHIRILL